MTAVAVATVDLAKLSSLTGELGKARLLIRRRGTNNLVVLFRKRRGDSVRDGSDGWKRARQRTPHPNLVPSLRRTAVSDVDGPEGMGRGHVRFKVAHDGIEERGRSCGTEEWVG